MLLRHYMTLLYWFRKNTRARERPGTIQCRVTVDKAEYNFSTGVYVQKDDWDAARQTVRGRTDEVKVANQRLTQLKTGLREAFNILEREGSYITPEKVVLRFQAPQRRTASLLEVAGRYLTARTAQVESQQITAATREADGVRLARLEAWLTDTKNLQMRPAEMSIRRAVRHELLDRNPMEGFSAKKEPPKPAVFLTPADLVKLWYYDFQATGLRKAADMFLFQCFTGLSWQDAANFRASEHVVPQPSGGLLIRIARQKTGTVTMIPFFAPAIELLTRYGGERLPMPSNEYQNRALKQIGYLCGFSQHLTTHVGRKTAGMVLLQDGVPMTIVSAVLGHRSVSITQSTYASVLPDTVRSELSKVYGLEVLGMSQQRKPFLREFSERLIAAA
jgi:integrase/recombinase XerD